MGKREYFLLSGGRKRKKDMTLAYIAILLLPFIAIDTQQNLFIDTFIYLSLPILVSIWIIHFVFHKPAWLRSPRLGIFAQVALSILFAFGLTLVCVACLIAINAIGGALITVLEIPGTDLGTIFPVKHSRPGLFGYHYRYRTVSEIFWWMLDNIAD